MNTSSAKYISLVCCSDRNNTFATLGALHWYDVRGKLADVNEYLCCGSGAILATVLALGIQPKKIAASLINSSVFDHSTQDLSAVIADVTKFLPAACLTLGDLYRITGRTVKYHVYNVTQGKIEVLSHVTTPMIAVVTACSLCYNVPYTGCIQSYCGNEYIDSSIIQPIPPTDLTKKTLCILSVPDIKAVSTFKAIRRRTADSCFSGRILGRQEDVECPERTAYTRALCTTYFFSVKKEINERDQILLLSVPFPYTEATVDQKYEMLARWKDYITFPVGKR